MPTKAALDAHRINGFLLEPEKIQFAAKGEPLYDPRQEEGPDENLVRSVMARGVKTPILASKVGDVLLVVDGRRRVVAAREANRRLTKEGKEPVKIKVMLERGQEADLFGTMIIGNACRQDDSGVALAEKIRRYMEFGRTTEEAAVTFGLPVAGVKQHLALFDAAGAVRRAVEKGECSVTAAAKLARLERKEQESALAELLADGKGKVTVRKAMKRANGGDKEGGTYPPSKKEIQRVVDSPTLGEDARMALQWVLDGLPRGSVVATLALRKDAS